MILQKTQVGRCLRQTVSNTVDGVRFSYLGVVMIDETSSSFKATVRSYICRTVAGLCDRMLPRTEASFQRDLKKGGVRRMAGR